MVKKIDEKRELKFVKYFPYKTTKPKSKNGLVLVGIGSNVGNSQMIFKKLFVYLQKHPKTRIIQTSPIYKNPPFGFLDQNDFHNAAVILKTTMRPSDFMRFLLHTEQIFGRKRAFKNSPRTLDLDIIFFEKLFVYNKKIVIPHPKWQERDSVIVPMIYLEGRYKTI